MSHFYPLLALIIHLNSMCEWIYVCLSLTGPSSHKKAKTFEWCLTIFNLCWESIKSRYYKIQLMTWTSGSSYFRQLMQLNATDLNFQVKPYGTSWSMSILLDSFPFLHFNILCQLNILLSKCIKASHLLIFHKPHASPLHPQWGMLFPGILITILTLLKSE